MLSDQYAGWGSKIGLFFGGIAALFWIPCYFLYPEVSLSVPFASEPTVLIRYQTKGRTYAELDELYARGVSPRKFAITKTAVQMDGNLVA